jgi:hypothetical protein
MRRARCEASTPQRRPTNAEAGKGAMELFAASRQTLMWFLCSLARALAGPSIHSDGLRPLRKGLTRRFCAIQPRHRPRCHRELRAVAHDRRHDTPWRLRHDSPRCCRGAVRTTAHRGRLARSRRSRRNRGRGWNGPAAGPELRQPLPHGLKRSPTVRSRYG